MVRNLVEKRNKDLFVTFLAILEAEETKEFLNEITEILSLVAESLEDEEIFKVSFAILRKPAEIERKIDDLIQTASLIQRD